MNLTHQHLTNERPKERIEKTRERELSEKQHKGDFQNEYKIISRKGTSGFKGPA